MSAAPIFHIGLHKTGSTFLQAHFWGNSGYFIFDRHRIISKKILRPYFGDFNADDIRHEIINKFGDAFICSSEDLCGNPLATAGGFVSDGILCRIHELFPEAKIVVFLREQTDYLQSLYVQHVKYGGTASLEKMLYPHQLQAILNPRFSPEYLQYDRFLDRIAQLFGRENLYAYSYHELKRGEALLRQLDSDLGLGISQFPGAEKSENVKMHKYTLFCSRFLNHFTDKIHPSKQCWVNLPYGYEVVRKLSSVIDQLPFNPKVVAGDFWKPQTISSISKYYKQSNLRLRERYNIEFEKVDI